MRNFANTNCDGNGDSDSDCHRNGHSHCDSNSDYAPTDAYSYSGSKGYPDAQTSADAPAKAIREKYLMASHKFSTRSQWAKKGAGLTRFAIEKS